MALFQPTFVIPSTRTEGTVDVSDNMEVKWQVNGQSAMIAFKIDFFRNDWSSTFVNTTGRQPVDGGGFRGIDRFGKVKFYTYAPNTIWKNNGFINGMQYKMQITQYYIDNPNEYYVRTSTVIDKETACYFGMPNQANPSQADYYLSFTLPEGKYPMGTKISYNISSENGFVIKNNAPEFLIMTKSTTKPTEGTDLGISTNEESVVQRSMDVFRTFTKPTMALYKTPNEDFIWQDGVGEELLNPRNLSITTSIDLGAGINNYFSFIQNGTQTMYASFAATNAISANTTIFYNTRTKQGYYELNGEQINLTITESTTQPIGANNIGKAYIDLATSIGYFHTNYMQDQGKPIRWVEWQVATANNGVVGDIIADTGKINTQTLDYSYNGFFNGQQYAIRCYGYSESEQYCDTGWIIFNVNIKAQGEYTGNFSVQCLPKENAALLQWEGVEVIPPTVNPPDFVPVIANGSVTLPPKDIETGEEYTVTWNKQYIYNNVTKESEEVPMNFKIPWTTVWKGNPSFKINLKEQIKFGENTTINALVFSPNGKYLAVGVNSFNNHRIVLYSVDNDTLTLFETISTVDDVNLIEFAPNNTMFIANGGSSDTVNIYEIQGNSILNKGTIKINGNDLQINNNIGNSSARFSPNGKFLVVAQSEYSYNVVLFSVNNFDIVFIKELENSSGSIAGANCASFSMDSNLLLIERSTIGGIGGSVLIFEFNNNTYNYKANLLNSTTDKYSSLVFSPLGNILAVAGINPTRAYINYYEINGNELNFNHSTSIRTGAISGIDLNSLTFSHDGNSLMCITSSSGENRYSIHIFAINGTQDIKLKEIQEKSYEQLIQFSPNSNYILTIKDLGNVPNYQDNIAIYNYTTGNGNLLNVKLDNINLLQLEKKGVPLYIKYNNNMITAPMYVDEFDSVIVIIQQNKAVFNFYYNDELVDKQVVNLNYSQLAITSISISGGDNGIKVDSVSVYNNEENLIDIPLLYQNSNFEPVWNSEQYKLYMTANFTTNLEGGTGTATGTGFRVYRREYNSSVLFPIATVPSTTLQVKDFGLRSGKRYEYYLYVYDSNGSFMTNVEGNQRVTTKYTSYSLMVCDYDSDNDEYHVRKQYLFINNATEGTMSNNNTPTINKNFTSYPTIMNSTSNYVSGTLSSLIGVIYTVPALIEQIGTYKFVKKPSTLDYFDSVDLQKELFQLSTLPYQLFLRDLKGNMRMVKITAPISMTVNTKQTQLSTTISIQWTEIDNADDVTVIQTPDDYGWNNDNQLLDVKLNVDTNTGELYAQYPNQYRGTKFTLVGAYKEILQASTPNGITPANITLSNVANKTTDGELNATIKVNKE